MSDFTREPLCAEAASRFAAPAAATTFLHKRIIPDGQRHTTVWNSSSIEPIAAGAVPVLSAACWWTQYAVGVHTILLLLAVLLLLCSWREKRSVSRSVRAAVGGGPARHVLLGARICRCVARAAERT